MDISQTQPLVSVIIPCFNSENHIVNALKSVKRQSYTNLEIIVINDGSKDATKDKVLDFKEENKDLNIVLLNQTNKGVSAARNAGMRIASGDWIAFLDSDDTWLPNKIERQLDVINNNPNIDLLGTNVNGVISDHFLLKKINHLTRIYPSDLFYKMFFCTPTVIFKRDILKTVDYFDESLSFCEDAKFFIQICRHYNCFLLKESLVLTFNSEVSYLKNGLSGNLWKMEKAELNNIKAGLKDGVINVLEFSFVYAFSLFKYFRRLLIVRLSH